MGEKLKIKLGRISIEADLSDASCIMGEPIEQGVNIRGLNINVSEETKQYSVMAYTTDVSTMLQIFQNKTFRSSSLLNAKLNDRMEKQRVGVSEFAGSRFITCFAHTCQESVPFWTNYGKDIPKEKVLLQFRNFAANFEDCIRIDFAKVKDDKLCFLGVSEYDSAINNHWTTNTLQYDLRVYIDSISVFDVDYVPPDSEVFTKDNSGMADIDFSRITDQQKAVTKLQVFNPTVLGKQKSNPWDYEKETRILCTLSDPTFKEWDYIDLQLHSEVFRDLRIILSPWDDGTLREQVEEIISSSGLPSDIIASITVEDSALKGTLNFS